MRYTLVFLAALAVFLGPNFLRADWDSAEAETAVETASETGVDVTERPRLVAAMFRSSWCGACRVLEPRVDDVREDYAGQPVDWVRFDFTFGRRGGLRETAEDAGIVDIYDQLAGGTGFMLLIDRETGDVYEQITMRYDREQIAAALDRWLAVTERLEAGTPVES